MSVLSVITIVAMTASVSVSAITSDYGVTEALGTAAGNPITGDTLGKALLVVVIIAIVAGIIGIISLKMKKPK